MDKNLLKAILLSFIVIVLWDWMGFFGKPVRTRVPVNKTTELAETGKLPPKESKVPESQQILPSLTPQKSFEEKTVSLKTPSSDITVSNTGGRVKSVKLNRYGENLDFSEALFPLLSIVRAGNETGLDKREFQIINTDEPGTVNLKCKLTNEVELSAFLNTTQQDFFYKVKIVIKNMGQKDVFFPGGIEMGLGSMELQSAKTYPNLSFARYTVENKTEYIDYKKIDGRQSLEESFYWAGIQNSTYCLIINESEMLKKATWAHDPSSKKISASVSTDDFTLGGGQEKVFAFNCYAGPKLYFHLKSLNLNFENIIDYGSVLGPITKLLVMFLNLLYHYTGNYGIAIIIMTILFKIATYPLSLKSMVSMKKMQLLQPHLKLIQNQYKNNQAMLQKEMLALYKKHGVNPLSGCLPMLIQLPIFIAFYKAIANSVELQGASFMFIKDLAAPDRMMILNGFSLNILPVIMGIVQFFSSKQTTTDPSQKHMIYFFPVFMVVIFYSMPSALVLYFLISTLVGIFQQQLVKIPEAKKEE